MKKIYCYDEKYKNELEQKGFKFLNFQIIDDKSCWLFENNQNLQFSRKTDIKKIYF